MKNLYLSIFCISLIAISCNRSGNSTGGGTTPTPTDSTIVPLDTSTTIFVRQNVYSLDTTDDVIRNYKKAISILQNRAADDPTSWAYQAAIHGSTQSPAKDGWNQCQHGSFFFLSWHRMYLYYFERIIREASGDEDWALPYWNYGNSSERALPLAFRSPTNSNPLYIPAPDRNSQINQGFLLPASAVSATNALSYTNFVAPFGSPASFGGQIVNAPTHFSGPHGALENQPHDQIHVLVGGQSGWMSNPNFAAQDPIFWLHHSNIDRLWNQWIALGDGRANPTDESVWMNQEFTFFDADGSKVTLTGKEVVHSASQLRYQYDDESTEDLLAGQAGIKNSKSQEGAPKSILQDPKKIAVATVNLVLDADVVQVQVKNNETAFSVPQKSNDTSINRYVLNLEEIELEQMPDGVYEVYIDFPEGDEYTIESKYYVGNIGLFGLVHMHGSHHGEQPKGTVSLEISKHINELGINPQDYQITIMRRTLISPPEVEEKGIPAARGEHPNGKIKIGEISVSKI